jgi:predicted O-methyltransferase YrrM
VIARPATTATMDDELLAVARSAKGFMPDDEGLALYRAGLAAAHMVPGSPLVEIGTYCAKSAVYLGAAAREAGTVVFSIDHHRGSEENQPGWEHHDPAVVDSRLGLMDTLPFARDTLARAGLEAMVVVGASATVAAHWSTPVALLFIDGGHGARVAWQDYRGWAHRVAPGGLLAIHDVFADPAHGGRPPYQLYLEALASGRFEDRPELGCGSLRVLRRLPATSA